MPQALRYAIATATLTSFVINYSPRPRVPASPRLPHPPHPPHLPHLPHPPHPPSVGSATFSGN